MHRAIVSVLVFLTLLIAGPAAQLAAQSSTPAAAPTEPPQQPSQPSTGPGGAEFAYDGIRAQHFGPWPDGAQAPTGYWLFEPLGPHAGVATTAPLPLVLFFHAFDIVDPELYHVWIDHLVRRGAILIFPDFQAANLPFDDQTIGALHQSAPGYIQTAVRAALAELASVSHVGPDLGRVAVVGHSSGATLAADYAGRAPDAGLPVPTALLLAMPGCSSTCDLSALGKIPATTRFLVLVGNQDTLAGEETAKRIWVGLGQVPSDHKDYVRLIGDDHGNPPTVADHFVALTAGFAQAYVDALDWYGTWKWFDALMNCSFADKDCDVALGNTARQRFMGTWSDGTPVAESQVIDDPGTPTP
jgi:acetyl esterase/lipase